MAHVFVGLQHLHHVRGALGRDKLVGQIGQRHDRTSARNVAPWL